MEIFALTLYEPTTVSQTCLPVDLVERDEAAVGQADEDLALADRDAGPAAAAARA